MLTVGSLFSGIGGIELGLERAGMRTLWQVESSPFCRAVLEKHWPDVERFEDVRGVGSANLAPVDLIAGGFPCQDISQAGRGGGLAGARSGLWFEFARIIRELRPRYVFVENVAILRSRGLDVVLGDLATSGYDAEWDCIPAAAVGAPHRRDRLWIVGYARESWAPGPVPDAERDELRNQRQRLEASERRNEGAPQPHDDGREGLVADPNLIAGRTRRTGDASESAGGRDAGGSGLGPDDLADANITRLERRLGEVLPERSGEQPSGARGSLADTGLPIGGRPTRLGWRRPSSADASGEHDGSGGPSNGQWGAEPNVGRVADGVPARVDRLTALGNAVVPQVAEFIGRLIVEAEEVAA